jgi:hypothetical protein
LCQNFIPAKKASPSISVLGPGGYKKFRGVSLFLDNKGSNGFIDIVASLEIR